MSKTLEEFLKLVPDLELLAKHNNPKRNKYLNDIFEKELLFEIFITLGMSANSFVRDYIIPKGMKTSASTIICLAKKYEIKTKNSKEAASDGKVRKRYKETCIKRYGAENVLSFGTTSYTKRNKTVFKKYGVENIFQLENTKIKSKSTMIEKYGVTNSIFLPNRKRNKGKLSAPHEKISRFLNENGIKHENEVPNKCTTFNVVFDRIYSPILDILILNDNLVIEIYGDHWHCNPKKFNECDLVGFTWKKIKKAKLKTAKEIWDFDGNREEHIRSFGYELLIFWESEIMKRETFERIKKEIMNSINKTKQLKIKSIAKIQPERRFNLEIEDNNNYFANNILVHNCRCIATIEGLFSRQGKPIVSVPHVHRALQALFQRDPDLVLDGELYSDRLSDNFNEIISLARKSKPTNEDFKKSEEMISYWVYDVPSCEGGFEKRIQKLHELITINSAIYPGAICVVETHEVKNQNDLDELYAKYMSQGYEGQMIRTLGKNYENKRTKQLLKRKEFKDEEFEILFVEEGLGNWAGYAKTITVKHNDGSGRVFGSGVAGTQEFTKALLAERDTLVGTTVTIKYQNLTPEGIPRFPVAVKFWKTQKRGL